MPKPMIYLTIAGFLLGAASLPGSSNHAGSVAKALELTARKWKDDKRTVPGSMLYAADLMNKSAKYQMLEAIQMAGGYAGGGRYFHCKLESWSLGRGS
jgi:hypothetical protein